MKQQHPITDVISSRPIVFDSNRLLPLKYGKCTEKDLVLNHNSYWTGKTFVTSFMTFDEWMEKFSSNRTSPVLSPVYHTNCSTKVAVMSTHRMEKIFNRVMGKI